MSRAAQPSPTGILIVGAGTTGLTLACALAARAAPFRLVERAPHATTHEEAVVLQPRSLEILDQLGLAAALVAQGRTVDKVRFLIDGRESLSFDLEPLREEGTAFPFQLIIRKRDVIGALGRRLTDLGGRVERGTEWLAASPEETASSGFVVGCDGPDSTVRKAAGLSLRETGPTTQTFLRAELDLDVADHQIGISSSGICALMPLPSGRAQLLCAGCADLRSLPALVRVTLPEVPVDDLRPLPSVRVRHGLAERYSSGAFFLCGGAAHVQSPASGQRTNSGIQDAWNLAWKLDLVRSGRAGRSLLDSYGAERRLVGEFFATSTDRLFEQASRAGPSHALMRRIVAPALARAVRGRADLGRLALLALTNLGVHYRPTVGDSAGDEPRAGDRAPLLPWLLKPFSSRFRLVAFTGTADEQARSERSRQLTTALASEPPDLVDVRLVPSSELEAYARYGVRDSALVLIRPDGHISWRSPGWDTLGLVSHLRAALRPS